MKKLFLFLSIALACHLSAQNSYEFTTTLPDSYVNKENVTLIFKIPSLKWEESAEFESIRYSEIARFIELTSEVENLGQPYELSVFEGNKLIFTQKIILNKAGVQIPEISDIPDEEELEEEIDIELDIDIMGDEELEIEFEDENDDDQNVYTIVDDQPEFPGGMVAFYEFISKNLTYPLDAVNAGIEGKVYVQFIVNKDGSLSDIKVVKGIGAGCDEESIRVFGLLPNFKPGSQRGNPVSVMMVLPINFKLSNGKD